MKISILLKRWTESRLFQRFSLAMILAASILIGLETFDSLYSQAQSFFKVADKIILGWFVIEILMKMLSYGSKPHRFFLCGWNVFDFLIVAVSICPAASPAFAAFRLLRVFRVLRLISGIPDLQLLVGALLKSLPSMGYVGLLLFLIVYVYGVLGTHLFRATDPSHFGNLGISLLSLFQVITLEGWTEIFRPLFNIHGWLAALYFLSFILLGTMILLNLLIGVVLRSMEQVQADLAEKQPVTGLDQEIEGLVKMTQLIQDKLQRLKSQQIN